MKFKWLWHESSNVMVLIDDERNQSLPLITVCDEDIKMMSPYYAYPLEYLINYYGFILIGEI